MSSFFSSAAALSAPTLNPALTSALIPTSKPASAAPKPMLNTGRPRVLATSAYHFVGKVAVAALATGLVALLVQLVAARESWLHNFFFMRGPIQWLIVGLGLYGVIEMLSLVPQSRREERGLRAWQHGGSPATDAGLVWTRFSRLQSLFASAAVSDVRAATREMAEEAQCALVARYSAVNMVTYVAPFLGLVGTLGGMSEGLSRSFGHSGALDMTPFRTALSSSLENSYAAIFITILLIVGTHLLRSREESVLAQTDSRVMDVLLDHELKASATLGLANGAAVTNPGVYFAQAVTLIGGQVRDVGTAVLQLAELVRATLVTTNETLAELRSTRDSVDGARVAMAAAGHTVRENLTQATSALTSAVMASGTNMAQALAATTGSLARQSQQLDNATQQLADCAGVLAGVKQAVERPRDFNVRITQP